jgi:hypothetical protein
MKNAYACEREREDAHGWEAFTLGSKQRFADDHNIPASPSEVCNIYRRIAPFLYPFALASCNFFHLFGGCCDIIVVDDDLFY